MHHLQHKKQAMLDENRLLQERNDVLIAEITDLKYGMDAVEEHARNNMGLIKKGETFYQLVDRKYLTKLQDEQGR